VYQIELEMQNQELDRTQEQLSHAKAKFETLFNQAPAGYCTLTLDGDMVDVNTTFAGFVNFDQAKLRGDNIKRFVHPNDQDLLHMHFQKVCRNEDAESVTLRFGSDESYIHVALHSVIPDDEDGDTLLCSLSNISREVVYQKELLASDARFRSLISSMDDVVFTMDSQHRHTGVYGRWVQQNSQTPTIFWVKPPPRFLVTRPLSCTTKIPQRCSRVKMWFTNGLYQPPMGSSIFKPHYHQSLVKIVL